MAACLRTLVRAMIPLGMAGFVILASTPSAHALLTLTATETTGAMGTFNVFDNQVGVDLNPAIGIIQLADNTTFGDFSVNGSISTSNSPGGLLAQLKSDSLSVTNLTGANQSVILKISDTGFTNPTPAKFEASANGGFDIAIGANNQPLATSVLGSTAHALAYADFTNTLFGTQHTIQDFSFAAGDRTTDSYSNSVGPISVSPQSTPYSMTVQLNYTLAGHNILSNRGDSITATAVPEPATLLSMAAGLPLLGLGAWVRRRRRSS